MKYFWSEKMFCWIQLMVLLLSSLHGTWGRNFITQRSAEAADDSTFSEGSGTDEHIKVEFLQMPTYAPEGSGDDELFSSEGPLPLYTTSDNRTTFDETGEYSPTTIREPSEELYTTRESITLEDRTTIAETFPVTVFPIDECPSPCLHGSRCARGVCICPPSCSHDIPLVSVCASDGKTYMTECEMIWHMCSMKRTLVVVSLGDCVAPTIAYDDVTTSNEPRAGITTLEDKSTAVETFPTTVVVIDTCSGVQCDHGAQCDNGQCVCPVCTQLYKEVCGTDRRTYTSPCELKRNACLNKTDVTLAYGVACEKVPHLPDRVAAARDQDIIGGVSAVVIVLSVGGCIGIALVVIGAVVMIRKRKPRSPLKGEERQPLTSSWRKHRKSSSGSSQYRVVVELRVDEKDNDTLGQNRNGIERQFSSTDTSVVELPTSVDSPKPAAYQLLDAVQLRTAAPAQSKPRDPSKRLTSYTENKVVEVNPEEDAIFIMDDVVFVNDEQIVTSL